MSNDAAWQSELDGLIDSRLATLRALDAAALDAAMAHPLGRHLPAVLAISDYAFEQWRRHPQWLATPSAVAGGFGRDACAAGTERG